MSTDQFEAWYMDNWGFTEDDIETLFERSPDCPEDYYRLGVRLAHHSWQAATSAIEAKCAELAAELEASEKRIAEVRGYNVDLAEESRQYQQRVAELEAREVRPMMFIDGDISPADAEKLAAVIRQFNEETESPAARMARIIRENPHPTNMCDMPAAGIKVKE
ncbi:hypothetical protein ACYQP7_002678 [Enterobacter hormaechei]